ncbi:MAG TPA: hypothetical protein VFF32_03175 [Dermatophilaceae bacterium]|nr:hypothetical protein [Dermatophilaceae bacterium]
MNGADKARLRQVRTAILGNRPDTSVSSTLYPMYVAVIVTGSYGVPAAQSLFRSLDHQWLADHVWSPGGAVGAAILTALLLTLVRLVGRVRGPVMPPLPYLDLVVASPMPRKVTLARNWRLSLSGSILGGLLIGTSLGAGLAIAKVAPPIVLLATSVGGSLLGVLVAELWLQGQLQGSALGRRAESSLLGRRRNALALLDITGLRRQAASNVTMGGAALSGDLRTARLDAVRPPTHARRVRLKSSGPLTVFARRDFLGLRRAPGDALYGLGFAAAGSGGLMLSLQSPRTPTMAPLLSLVLCYLGFGAWCEGLRLHSDNSGTSRLLGLPYRDTALAHLAVPVVAWVLTTIVVGVGLSLVGMVGPTAVVWSLGTGALLAGTHLMAAFRGLPPIGVFGPKAGVPAMIFWYAKPILATLVVGTATAAWAARAANPWIAFFWLLIATAGVVAWGLKLVGKRDRRD